MHLVYLKNNTTRVLSFEGKDLQVGEVYEVSSIVIGTWRTSSELFTLISDNDIIVNNGEIDFSPVDGWKWFLGNDDLPRSEVGNKIWVHSSSKPVVTGKQFYSTWIGAGDDDKNHTMGTSDLLAIKNEPGTPIKYVDMAFDQTLAGDVYIHEGFMMWEGAHVGDYINAHILAEGSHLQQLVNLDLIVDTDGYVSFSHGGPGTGTHGFADQPHLLSRTFSKDGDWDYSETNGLSPNFTKTGLYKINVNEQVVHRIMHKLPVIGSSGQPMRLVSEDCLKLPHGYFIRVETHNISDSDWSAAFIITAYKERTVAP
jgi:hypothetical protein